ncbi:methylmalonic aciduria type A protein, mitochondrial-like isoform X2 [Artemia franciscana]|uniref:methylmalonic aciduria type A protein, mitochondrial-like isoform X2 n=1 Tax=Artemia franciscana TaxID=6661 RepID=UPI0032DABCAE
MVQLLQRGIVQSFFRLDRSFSVLSRSVGLKQRHKSKENIITVSSVKTADVDLLQTLDESEISFVRNLYDGLTKQIRHSLSQSITLVESSHPRKQLQAQLLLSLVLDHQKSLESEKGEIATSFRIGISGSPGAGKSTFLEEMGKRLTKKGHRVAVLAVDPSSSTTGGSLLADKTRMPQLSVDPNAFIRPSPSGCHVGGVTRSTNEAIVMCEGAGFNTIFIETVGVGQSEYEVADMVDLFVLLIPPAGGDELQGLKRGIVERCHIVVVNKCDGDLIPASIRIATEYTSALKFMRSPSKNWKPLVFRSHPSVRAKVPILETEVANGTKTPGYAADLLLREFFK